MSGRYRQSEDGYIRVRRQVCQAGIGSQKTGISESEGRYVRPV